MLRWLLVFIAGVLRAEELQKFVFEKPEMGVGFRISIFSKSEAAAKAAGEAAFARIKALNAVFSDYEEDSELTKLSRTSGSGHAVKVSEPLWRVLSRAQLLAEDSGGAFDVTGGPLTALWRRARRSHEFPAPARIAELRARVGWRKLKLDPSAKTATLTTPDMRLDLGAIAKGYACDEALRVLSESGHRIALVAGAGDMSAGDPPPGRKGWRITVEPLDAEGGAKKPAGIVVELANAAIATSGDRFQRLDLDGKRYSHILDLRTGQPLTDHGLVTVIARDGLTADSLATALSVLGPVEGAKLLDGHKAVARWQRQPGAEVEIVESPGWAEWVVE